MLLFYSVAKSLRYFSQIWACLTNDLASLQIIIVEDRPFGFDHVFEQTASQEEVFEAIGRPLVEKMLSGFNCSLLAYGQSGNGKTYTMGLNGTSDMASKEAGIIIRTLRCILDTVHSEASSIADLKLEVSFIEIYNEKVYDLLSPNYTEAENIRGPFKKLFTKRSLKSEEDAQEILAEAYQKRHVRPTKINLTSSRSHAVFTIYATIKNSDFCSIQSELNLVDLAGAEGVRKTGHHGQALAEGVNINQGLLSVGRILQAIAKGDKVIPYRESVLTRVLQGNNMIILSDGNCILMDCSRIVEPKLFPDLIGVHQSLKVGLQGDSVHVAICRERRHFKEQPEDKRYHERDHDGAPEDAHKANVYAATCFSAEGKAEYDEYDAEEKVLELPGEPHINDTQRGQSTAQLLSQFHDHCRQYSYDCSCPANRDRVLFRRKHFYVYLYK